VSVWILGVQREENEAKRMIEHLDVGGPKPNSPMCGRSASANSS
jgi:hypothetical protein